MAALFKYTKMYIVGMVIVNLISVLQFVNLHYSNTLIPEQLPNLLCNAHAHNMFSNLQQTLNKKVRIKQFHSIFSFTLLSQMFVACRVFKA